MSDTTPQPSHRHLLPLGIVLLTGIIAYSNSFNVPFQFDDVNISDKAKLLATAYSSSSRQFADFTFLLNHYIHGKNVLGFHLLNLLIHLCSAATVYFLAASFLQALKGNELGESDESRFISNFVPFATAMLFVCHPIQTQAVTYIVQRYTSLATLFYLLSTVMFIQARIRYLNRDVISRIWVVGILSFISGLIAMRCKEIAFTLPLMLIIVEVSLFKGRLLRNRIFLGCMAALFLIIPAQQIFLNRTSAGIDDIIYSIDKGSREELNYSRMDYLQTEFRVVITYLRLLFFPVNQNLDYDYPLQKVFFAKPVILSLIAHILILLSSAVMFFRSRTLLKGGRQMAGVCVRLCAFGIVWFYVALLVESSFIPILDVIFEHRVYLPSFGFFLFITSGSALLLGHRKTTRKSAFIALGLICLLLTTATIRRNMVWSDELRLWQDVAAKSPNKPRVLNNLAAFYLSHHKPAEATVPLLHALEREPGDVDSLKNLEMLLNQIPAARGRYNKGLTLTYRDQNGKVDVRFLSIWYANTINNIGLVYELQGNRAKAVEYYERAVILMPKDEVPWLNLAYMSVQLGNNKRAIEAFGEFKRINPQRAKEVEPYLLKP